jgi:flagellar FliL protein
MVAIAAAIAAVSGHIAGRFVWCAAPAAATKPKLGLRFTAPTVYVEMKPITVRLAADPGGEDYAKLTLELKVPLDEKELVEREMPEVRDTVIGILSAKTVADLTRDSDARKLKKEIADNINRRIGAKVFEVLLDDYVVE